MQAVNLPDIELLVAGASYCIKWIDEDGCDHVLFSESDSEMWTSIAVAYPNDGVLTEQDLPWSVVRELLARQLKRGGFTGIVRSADGHEETL